MIKELKTIRSERFIFWTALFTVICLAPISYFVFESLSRFGTPTRQIHAFIVAAAIASAIMIYTYRKNVKVANYFMQFEIGIACFYYIENIGWDWKLIPALGFAFILPYSVKMYALEIGRKIKDDEPEISEDDKHNLKIFMDENPTKKPQDFFKSK